MDLQRINECAPKDAFVVRDYHKLLLDDGSVDHNSLEDWFCEIEAEGIEAARTFVSAGKIDRTKKDQLTKFVSLQFVRTPVARAGVEAFLKETVTSVADIAERSGRLGPFPDDLLEYGSSFSELIKNRTIEIDIVLPQVTLASLYALENIAEIISNMKWTLIKSKADEYFILSDNPCTIVDKACNQHGMGIGLAHQGVEVTLPLDRQHCLLLTRGDVPDLMNVAAGTVKQVNRRSALFGKRFFVAPIKSRSLLRGMNDYFGAFPEAECHTIPRPGRNGGPGNLVIRRTKFRTEKHERLYFGLKPLVPRKAKLPSPRV